MGLSDQCAAAMQHDAQIAALAIVGVRSWSRTVDVKPWDRVQNLPLDRSRRQTKQAVRRSGLATDLTSSVERLFPARGSHP